MFNKKVFMCVKGCYFIFFSFILMLRSVGPYLLLPTKYDTLLFWPAGIFGCLLVAVDFIIAFREKNLRKYDWLLYVFLGVMLISSLMNLKYGYSQNIKLLMWQSIFFFIVYQFGKDYGTNIFFKVFSWLISSVWFFTNSISLYMFVIQYGIKIPIKYKYYPVRLGWLGNRLFGVYTDPNFGAVISFVVIIIGMYYLITKTSMHMLLKSLIILNIIIQFSFIALSGSRTTLVCMLVTTFIFSFFSLFSSNYFAKKLIYKWIVSLTVGCFSMIGIYGLNHVTANAWAYIPTITHLKNSNSPTKPDQKVPPKEKIDLDRPDTEGGDISNLRFQLWASAVEIFKSNPISGGSPGYYIEYAHDKLPHTFMGKDNLTAHSFIFLIMAATGGLGLITFFSFFFIQCYKVLRYCFTKENLIKDEVFFDILIILTIAVSALFITELVLVSTIGAFVFWSHLGKIQKGISE
ncbi:O-antigen ligase family protein [Enterococcus sp. C50]|uniref:O-antigen ligase family protein n=1 Tax=Enterococcus sp. C50 TaxID=3231311 RepID=UPI0034A0A7CC